MMLLAYLGPDTLLPMTSVFAAAVGFAAMFGRNSVVMAARGLKYLGRLPRSLMRAMSKAPGTAASPTFRNDRQQPRWRGPVAAQRRARSKRSVTD